MARRSLRLRWPASWTGSLCASRGGKPALKSKDTHRSYFAPIAVHITDAQGNSPLNPRGERQCASLAPSKPPKLDPRRGPEHLPLLQATAPRFSRVATKVARNDPSFCGSGKKFKHGCGRP